MKTMVEKGAAEVRKLKMAKQKNKDKPKSETIHPDRNINPLLWGGYKVYRVKILWINRTGYTVKGVYGVK